MRRRLAAFGLIALLGATGAAQAPQPAEQDREAVKQAAYDYAEGYYQGAADRMERALHPVLVKRGLMARDGGAAVLVPMNAETLIEATRAGGGKATPADARNLVFTLLDIQGDVASAKIFTAVFNDYLHFVKVNSQWRLVNVLWQPPSPAGAANADADKAAVSQALKDYFAAVPAADAPAVERLVHPEAVLRSFGPSPSGRLFVREGNRESLAEAVRSKRVSAPQSPDVAVLDVYDNIASVKVTMGTNVSYWHLARQQGQWRLVNRLSR